MLDADRLLTGPRGRRLCFELTAEADDGLLGWVGDLTTPEPGSAPFVAAGSIWTRALQALRSALPSATEPTRMRDDADLEGFIAHLAAIEVDLDARRLMRAFAASADRARYWQSPDQEDVLCAHPAVIEALRPIAERVVAHPAASWWSTPASAEQWWLVDPDLTDGEDVTDEWWEVGGWWSTPMPAIHTTRAVDGLGPVGLWLEEDAFDHTRYEARLIDDGGAVLEISTADAWVELCRRHPREAPKDTAGSWHDVTGWRGRWVLPDWRAVAHEWDGVHIQPVAYLEGATRALPIDDDTATMVAGWHPDATYRFGRPAVVRTERWQRDDDYSPWRRG
ncbi:hypothetical protein JL108_10945 [Aeromicrobium sp. YIM 150415]|uniref:hypothetical protein n=1 Tax=Aeromicrobium sp. YIM 150415 TaxID=2803912 RepID=UPI0019667C8E|nr:hypothetical protein [Aeromicrobium sp. YIM 150415]MBM9463964.1 hypothetical protein [Aeromicrobium sp. YIM 150415]